MIRRLQDAKYRVVTKSAQAGRDVALPSEGNTPTAGVSGLRDKERSELTRPVQGARLCLNQPGSLIV